MTTVKNIFSSISNKAPVQVVLATVQTVDKAAATCDLLVPGSPERPDTRLRAIIDEQDTGLVIYPKKDSVVLVGMIGDMPESSFICGYSEIEEISIKIESSVLLINKDGFVFNEGKLHGLIKVEKNVEKLNALENDINSLKQCFSTWAPVANDGGAALKSATATWAANQLQSTQQDDLEDTKVKH